MTFTADGMPVGLHLDLETGILSGRLPKGGVYPVTLRAKNSLGTASKKLRNVAGDQISLTPAMGWNSWNCWAATVS